jgi:hypothetical protein
MENQGLRELLVRAVLDDGFREQVRADPDAAAEAFGLSEAELAALRRGTIVAPSAGPTRGQDPAPAPAPQELVPTPPPLTIRLLLRVMQSIDEIAGEQGRMHFTAALQPMAADADAASMPAMEVDATVLPGKRLEDIVLDIRVLPHVARGADGALGVSFRHAVLPVPGGAPMRPGVDAEPAAGLAELAEAVRKAVPEARPAALLDLVGALSAEAGNG